MKNNPAPNFFIPGAPKCGTTSLSNWLADNPYVYFPSIKEPNFFNSDLPRAGIKRKSQYLRIFWEAKDEHQAIGEASVWYLCSRVAVPRIEEEISCPRYVVCIRNPVDMAYSLHGQNLKYGAENINDFEEAWRAQKDRGKGRRIPFSCHIPDSLIYGQACSLGTQLKQLLQRVPRERVLIVFLEDMKHDAREQYTRVLDFLGIPDDGREDFPAVNQASGARWPILAKTLGALLKLRRHSFPYLGTGVTRSLLNINKTPDNRRGMSVDMRNELEEYFLEEIQAIEKITGRDLSHWRYSATKKCTLSE